MQEKEMAAAEGTQRGNGGNIKVFTEKKDPHINLDHG